VENGVVIPGKVKGFSWEQGYATLLQENGYVINFSYTVGESLALDGQTGVVGQQDLL
jgi:hypothetical protein